MHGIILTGLKAFVVDTYGQDAWSAIRDHADLSGKLYVPVAEYPDEHVLALIAATADLSGADPETIQRAFGQYLVPTLVETYGVHVDADWTGLELVENVEEYVHEGLRAKQLSEFAPPGLDARRIGERRVIVTYDSERELCALAKGILEGVGDYYGRQYDVSERQCMHDGARHCELLVVDRGG